MKVYTVSDIHIDYKKNRLWLHRLSREAYQKDVLILAGDISGNTKLFIEAFDALKKRFAEVLFIPGNHDLWVQAAGNANSIEKFHIIRKIADDYGIRMGPAHFGPLSIVPLFGWYDYSFGEPCAEIVGTWADFTACRWPDELSVKEVARYFTTINEKFLDVKNETVISFSHFLPRIDVMPNYIPSEHRILYPVLGSTSIEKQIRLLRPKIHIYGHSHFNRKVTKNGIKYINNAFGYPHETRITAKTLLCVFEKR